MVDENLVPIRSDATIDMDVKLTNTMTAADGRAIFNMQKQIKASEFGNYERTLTGAETGELYMIIIDASEFSEFEQYEDYAFGEATLTETARWPSIDC